ncbi:MAG: hypothetical protein LAT84_00405 [Balneolia bacterium]|nr:hypothetical protein [Balneolia bacterium]
MTTTIFHCIVHGSQYSKKCNYENQPADGAQNLFGVTYD